LLTREELAKAEEHGDYFRIIPDDRDLNYQKYFTEGEQEISHLEDYNSHNTRQLDVAGTREMLLKLDLIQAELKGLGAR
jgi:UDP-N-acetylglucosamine 4,6-dehydratase/5-epimerase